MATKTKRPPRTSPRNGRVKEPPQEQGFRVEFDSVESLQKAVNVLEGNNQQIMAQVEQLKAQYNQNLGQLVVFRARIQELAQRQDDDSQE